MSLNKILWTVVTSGVLLACGSGKKSGSKGRGPGAEVDKAAAEIVPIGKLVWLFQGFNYPFKPEHGRDAVTYTHGSMLLKTIPTADGFALTPEDSARPAEVVEKKFVLLQPLSGQTDPVSALSADDKNFLASWCTNLQVTLPGGGKSGTLGADEFEVSWKSHFSPEHAARLGLLLLAANVKFQCGLEFGMYYRGALATEFMYLAFDPAPYFDPTKIHPADLYSGTDRFVVARDESVMLPLVRGNTLLPFETSWQQIAVELPADIKPGLLALNADDFPADVVSEADGDSCELRLTDTMKVLNADEQQAVTLNFGQHPTRSFSLQSAGYAELPGKTTPEVCKTIEYKVAGSDRVQFKLTCAQVRDLVKGGDCGVRVVWSNPDDPDNTVERVAAVTGMKYDLLDLQKPDRAVTILPQAQDNPIRTPPPGLTLSQFTTVQLNELAKSFDLWQLASPSSYVTYFKDQISGITYDAGSELCDGAGAYAYLSIDNIYWCPGGGLAGDALTESKSPYYLVYRATTALHETLHTRGNPHDTSDLMNPPCSADGGTAYSGVIAVDVFSCPHDACFGFKELAREEFILELNYSLKNDARRFQGQCDTWAKALGVSF